MKPVFHVLYAIMIVVLVLSAALAAPVAAQDAPVTVPDITGMSIPRAAATLNAAGLTLGKQTNEPWSEEAGQPGNTIVSQAVAAGTAVEYGTTVDVSILRAPNMLLTYNAQGITLINQSDSALELNGLEFSAVDGQTPAAFAGTRWSNALPEGRQCVQLWAVRRTGPDKPEECSGVHRWLSTVDSTVHFWTGLNGVSQFNVTYDGVQYATCDGAVQGEGRKTCQFYLPAGAGAAQTTPYVYFAYTTDQLLVLNQSSDQWMPLSQTSVYNYNPNISVPGASMAIGDPELFHNPAIVANIKRLAPDQCLWYTDSSPEITQPVRTCDAIARLDISPELIFWAADFEVESTTDGLRHTCPAARPDQLTVCVMPR